MKDKSYSAAIMSAYLSIIFFLYHVSNTLGKVQITSPTMNPLSALTGSNINLECSAHGGAQVLWFHNGKPVSQIDRFAVTMRTYPHTNNGKSILALRNLQEKDSGLITCRDSVDQSYSDDIILTVVQSNHIPSVAIVEPDTDMVSVVPGSSFTFKCISRDGNYLQWFHNGMQLRSSTHVLITEARGLDGIMTTLLTPRRVTSVDAGTYMCQEVGNPHNTDQVEVKIEEPRSGYRVEIVEPSVSHITLTVGTPLHLKCTASRNTRIIWKKDGIPLQDGTDAYIITEAIEDSYRTSLLSRDVSVVEESTYTCANQEDVSESDEVRVEYGDSNQGGYKTPTNTDSVVMRMQTSVSLQCRIDADGSYDVEWTQGGSPINPGEKYIIRNTELSTLTIRNTDRNDIGQYKCSFISKDTGKVAGVVIYNVSGILCPPLEPYINGTPLNCPRIAYVGDTCTIQCDVKSSNVIGSTVSICDIDKDTGHAFWSDTHSQCAVPVTPAKEDGIPSSLSQMLLRAGEPVRLQCDQAGKWIRKNMTLYSGDKYSIINGTLVIHNAGKEDGGEYSCIVYDSKGAIYGYQKYNVTYMACSSLKTPVHGYMSDCSETPLYGESCVFHCEEGYQMYGSPLVSCLLTQSETQTYWSTKVPECRSTSQSEGHGSDVAGAETNRLTLLTVLYMTLTSWLLIHLR